MAARRSRGEPEKKVKLAKKVRLKVIGENKTLERSGQVWLPENHHLRVEGLVPDTVPSMGQKCNQELKVNKEPYLDVQVVESYTGAPLEWTPREIYDAWREGSVEPEDKNHPEVRALFFEGKRQSMVETVRLIKPHTKLPLRYEEAAPVGYSAGARGLVQPGYNQQR
jgi:hypothetical protein